MASKSNFLDKVLGRISRLDAEGLQTVVQRLARERAFLETLFNAIEDGVLVIDENGRILYFNESVGRLLGWSSVDSMEGQTLSRFLPEIDLKQLLRRDSRGGRVMRHELEIHYPQPRFIRLYAAQLDEKVGTSGVALILHDATEARQQTFEEIESERLHALTLLAASVAHEIGNPLNALHIHLQLMEREIKKLRQRTHEVTVGRLSRKNKTQPIADNPQTEDAARKLENYLNVAKGEIARLDYIITQFLQAIRPSTPQIKIASLNDVVRETLELLRPEFENRGIRIVEKLSRTLPPSPLDPGQIKQALVNLAKNAMQAMTTGGAITFETGEGPDYAWVSVSDTGGGIPEEQINRIFEPFYTTKKKGTGLGLMIVQRIVRDHGGKIELESHVGQGTAFRVCLPLHERRPRLLEARVDDPDQHQP